MDLLRVRNSVENSFLRSALSGEECINNIDEIKLWFEKRRNESIMNVNRIDFKNLIDWEFGSKSSNLKHLSGKFFSFLEYKKS